MKKMLTKMLAVAMAWAMLLSCTVMASATGNWTADTIDGKTPQSGIGGEGELKRGWGVTNGGATGADTASLQVSSNGYRNYASGEAKGVSHNEGKVPSDVIRLMMPTVGNNTLDMILDPHNLINATKGARYGSSNVDFSTDTQLYFVNKIDSAGKVYYTNESQDLTITNKSSVPVNVNLSLRVNKGSGFTDIGSSANGFKFVPNSSGLTNTTMPTMYLALVCGTESVAVAEGSAGMHDWEIDNQRFLALKGSGGGASTLIGNISSTGVISSGTLQWLTSDGETKAHFLAHQPSVTVEILYAASDGSADWFEHYPLPSGGYPGHPYAISTYSDGNGKIIKITASSAGDSTDAYDAIIQPDYLTSYTPDHKNIGYVLNATRETPISIVYYDDANKPVAAMYFNLKKIDLGATSGVSVTSTGIAIITSAGGVALGDMPEAGIASMTASIDEAQNAYVNAYHPTYGYYLAFREEDATAFATFGGTGSAGYSDLSFHLKGGIGGTDQYWDNIGGDITLDLIWDVYAAEKLNGAKPKITVTTKPSGSGTKATKTLVLTYTSGTGDYQKYYKADPETTITLSDNTTLPMTPDTAAKTLKNTSVLAATVAGKTATVVFKPNNTGIAAGKKDLKIKVSGLA